MNISKELREKWAKILDLDVLEKHPGRINVTIIESKGRALTDEERAKLDENKPDAVIDTISIGQVGNRSVLFPVQINERRYCAGCDSSRYFHTCGR